MTSPAPVVRALAMAAALVVLGPGMARAQDRAAPGGPPAPVVPAIDTVPPAGAVARCADGSWSLTDDAACTSRGGVKVRFTRATAPPRPVAPLAGTSALQASRVATPTRALRPGEALCRDGSIVADGTGDPCAAAGGLVTRLVAPDAPPAAPASRP